MIASTWKPSAVSRQLSVSDALLAADG